MLDGCIGPANDCTGTSTFDCGPVDGGQKSQKAWMTTVGSISETHMHLELH